MRDELSSFFLYPLVGNFLPTLFLPATKTLLLMTFPTSHKIPTSFHLSHHFYPTLYSFLISFHLYFALLFLNSCFVWRWWAFWVTCRDFHFLFPIYFGFLSVHFLPFLSFFSFFFVLPLLPPSFPPPPSLSTCLLCFPLADSCDSDLELSMVRHQPEGLDQLQAQTQFTRKELQSLYRGFKNVRLAASTDVLAGPDELPVVQFSLDKSVKQSVVTQVFLISTVNCKG